MPPHKKEEKEQKQTGRVRGGVEVGDGLLGPQPPLRRVVQAGIPSPQ